MAGNIVQGNTSERKTVHLKDEFSDWTVIAFSHKSRNGNYWICQCKCGISKPVQASSLLKGISRRCRRCADTLGRSNTGKSKHGGSKSREYNTWKAMQQRCCNKSHSEYPNYGGRGISVCSEWQESFATFLKDMGPRPSPEYTIERIDVNGDYHPGNCRWATHAEQNRNMRRNRYLSMNGETLTITDWARRIGVTPSTLDARIANGWSLEEALSSSKDQRFDRFANAVTLSHNGRTLSIPEWSKMTGICERTIRARLRRGWSVEEALNPQSK